MLKNIPQELRDLPQWVVTDQSKRPIDPKTRKMASPTDPATWATFEQAIAAGFPYVGFVLTKADPYCVIDLDNKPEKPATNEQLDRFAKILGHFETYTELSRSGMGYHIICKGAIPNGVHRDSVEIYSDARYIICTGNVIKPLPIVDYSTDVLQMFEGMQVKEIELQQIDSDIPDSEIVAIAMRAANADKFNALCQGDFVDYPSQSEADFALLSIFAFYTKDNEQVKRLFRYSALGKRDKATKDDKYLNRALRKIRANEPPEIDLTQIAAQAAALRIEEPKVGDVPHGTNLCDRHTRTCVTMPPGLVGEIANYIYTSAVRPVPEVGIAGAIAFVSGMIGRAFNISGTGLNQYIMLLAKTGSGKEGASNGIDRLISTLRQTIPVVDQFIGPAAFASGQALIKTLDETPCFLSVLGEFGLTLQQICDNRANSSQQMLRRVLLDLYAKSGWDKVLRSSVYSDKEKNTKIVQAPALTIFGESTPETFFDGLDHSHISEGLIPRFSIIEYTGLRPPRNPYAGTPPEPALLERLNTLATVALTTLSNNTCGQIGIDRDALLLLDELDQQADKHINTDQDNIGVHLWNRAHLKALKLAGLLAAADNPYSPVVTQEYARWAIDFTVQEITTVAARFDSGDVGTGDSKQLHDVKRVIKQYLVDGYQKVSNYGVDKRMHQNGVIPYTYISRRVVSLSAFKKDRRGATMALKIVVQEFIDQGFIVELKESVIFDKYKAKGRHFGLGPQLSGKHDIMVIGRALQ